MAQEDLSPAEVLAEAVQNGQVHPAVAGFLAHLDTQLDGLINPPAPAGDDGDQDDSGTDDKGDAKPPVKATPSAVAGRKHA